MAFFAQADRDAVIQGPEGLYPPISARDFLDQRVKANYTAPGTSSAPAQSSAPGTGTAES